MNGDELLCQLEIMDLHPRVVVVMPDGNRLEVVRAVEDVGCILLEVEE